MSNQTLFYLVFLSQVLLISFYFPRKMLKRMRHVIETYPPSTYPKLYPAPLDSVEKSQRTYRNANLFVLLIGLALVLVGVSSSSEEMLNWDNQSVLTIYLFLQYLPMMLLGRSELKQFALMRRASVRTARTADLRPRRLFDFVSPASVGIAIFLYIALVLLVLYIRQDPFPGFGGALWNIGGVTALNLFFAGVIIVTLYGKKADPYQAYGDRLRVMEMTVKILVF